MATWKWTGDILIGPTGLKFLTGSGDPSGVVTAPVGSLYLRTNGTSGQTVYFKETGTGNTGWAAAMTGGTPTLSIEVAGVPISVQSVLNFTGTGLLITDEGSGNVNLDVEVTTIPYSNLSGTVNTVGEALDVLLPLTVNNLTNDVLHKEVGSTLSTVNVTWSLSDTVSGLEFTSVPATFTPVAGTPLVTSSTSQTFIGGYSSVSPIAITWTLQATKGTQIVTASTTVNFQLKNYFGAHSADVLDSADVVGLSSQFATSKVLSNQVYSCSGGKYVYFCYPQSYGDPTSVTVNGLKTSDWVKTVVLVTNSSGYTSNYNVIRLTNIQTGILTVSWA